MTKATGYFHWEGLVGVVSSLEVLGGAKDAASNMHQFSSSFPSIPSLYLLRLAIHGPLPFGALLWTP